MQLVEKQPVASFSKMPVPNPFMKQVTEPYTSSRPHSNPRNLTTMQMIQNKKKQHVQHHEPNTRVLLTKNVQVVGTAKPKVDLNE